MAVSRKISTAPRNARQSKHRQQSSIASIVLILAGIGLLAAVFFVLNQAPAEPNIWPVSVGKAMPDLALKDLSGKTIRVSDFAGRPVLVNAWATWCPPCRKEMPLLEAYYQAHQDVDLVFLAINAGEDQETVRQFITQNGFDFPVLLDPDGETLYRMGIDDYPTTILVGRDGSVQAVHIGLLTNESLVSEFTPYLKR